MTQIKAAKVVYSVILLCFSIGMCRGADEDPLQDFCVADKDAATKVNGYVCKDVDLVRASDFFFAGLAKEGNVTASRTGWVFTPANVQTFPGLNTLGLAINRVDFAVGGVNPPHVHPRASEIIFVVKGTILAGFVSTSNQLYAKTLNAGELFVAPRGLVHFQINTGKTKALALALFNSQLPGLLSLPTALFGSSPKIPSQVLTKSFQISNQTLYQIFAKFS